MVIDRPGILALLQDEGRRGVQQAGLTEGGAADEHAYRWANKLLGNSQNAACVEVLLGQFAATFTEDALIAVTGADQDFCINGQPAENWSTHRVQAGDQICFRQARHGLRAYLGVVGGWRTPLCFGSRSVVVREGLGGLDGGALKAGDQLTFRDLPTQVNRRVAHQYIPDYGASLTLKVVPGYQCHLFSDTDRRAFTHGSYKVTQQIDRMGYRLEGVPLQPPVQGVISEGIAFGAVQIPGNGQPIVLLRDRQTIGGYPKIGCVTSLSCSRLSQRGPGAQVAFEFCDVAQARRELVAFRRFFQSSA